MASCSSLPSAITISSLAEARNAIANWKEDYNNHRPHPALGNIPPDEFATKIRLEMQAA
ncbi:integrase core domain-containing protein [Oricola sp.]|uniref:integrase core domain-containing protein n=1 Tax=Oricola sp. TaxID=1979950 RepID=UPI003519A922